jgi:N-acetylated-alpha-linked acidic dipeptidase
MQLLPRKFFVLIPALITVTPFFLLPSQLSLRAENDHLEKLEGQFVSKLNPENLKSWMEVMTARPHHVGSPGAKANSARILELFRSWGYQTEIEIFHVLFPTPISRQLELTRPIHFKAVLEEMVVTSDSAAEKIRAEGLPPYNAYSADGEVEGDLVYVNQGLPRDYEALSRMGISVKGKIVIARYGGSWRGIKPKVAAEHGAIGCIIYNDPLADGYAQGAPYPKGAFKHSSAVQRGSVIDLPRRPGDPLTPNYGSTKTAQLLSLGESDTIMKIPVLPISSSDARPFLENLGGRVAPSTWRGALPITYRIGGIGLASVKMRLKFSWDRVPTYNIIARMEGTEWPDEWVIRGNHHDAWVIGAKDPISGLVVLLEQARIFGELYKQGWRPRRTLIFAAWDGEEPGLLGSTEWVEHHSATLREKAVAYINTDGYSRGFLGIRGSHSLQRLAAGVAEDVNDPITGDNLFERHKSWSAVQSAGSERRQILGQTTMTIDALGSGSDYTAFLQHAGIPSLDVRFGGEAHSGEYHTMFDTFDHYSRHGDPGFQYGIALVNVCGRLTLRLSEGHTLPFDFEAAATTFSSYAEEVIQLAEKSREDAETFNQLVSGHHFQRAADPTETYIIPEMKKIVPYFNFAPLRNAVARLKTAATGYSEKKSSVKGSLEKNHPNLEKLNSTLFRAEQSLTNSQGLPRRPWFRHQIYAPGFYTGYGVKTLPGIREAIEENNWDEVAEQTLLTSAAIERFAAAVEKATSLW